MIANAAALLNRRFFGRASKSFSGKGYELYNIRKQKSVELLQLSQSYRIEESEQLLNEFEELQDRQRPEFYTKFLLNKIYVEYHFRRYGSAEMTLLNGIAYNKNLFDDEGVADFTHKLCLLYFVYQTHKLTEALDQLEILRPAGATDWRRQVAYYKALTHLYSENQKQARKELIELLNNFPQEQMSQQKIECVIALLTLKMMFPQAGNQNSAEVSRSLYKRLIKRQPVDLEMFKQASVVELINCLISYERSEEVTLEQISNDQLEPRYRNLTRLLNEEYSASKNYTEAQKYARFSPPNDIHNHFLQAVRLFDERKLAQAKEQLNDKIFSNEEELLPETDGIRYEAYKLLELIVKKLEPEQESNVAYEAEMFRMMHNLEPFTKGIHYFNLPFRKAFSLDNYAV